MNLPIFISRPLFAISLLTLSVLSANSQEKQKNGNTWGNYEASMKKVNTQLGGSKTLLDSVERERVVTPAAKPTGDAMQAMESIERRVTRSLHEAKKVELLAALDSSSVAWRKHLANVVIEKQKGDESIEPLIQALAGTHMATLKEVIQASGVPLLPAVTSKGQPLNGSPAERIDALVSPEGGGFDEASDFSDKKEFMRYRLKNGDGVICQFWIPAGQRAVITLHDLKRQGDIRAYVYDDLKGEKLLTTIKDAKGRAKLKMLKPQKHSGYVFIITKNVGGQPGQCALFCHTLTYHEIILKESAKFAAKELAKHLIKKLLEIEDEPNVEDAAKIEQVDQALKKLFEDDDIFSMEIEAAERLIKKKVAEVSKDHWAARLTSDCAIALLKEIWKTALLKIEAKP